VPIKPATVDEKSSRAHTWQGYMYPATGQVPGVTEPITHNHTDPRYKFYKREDSVPAGKSPQNRVTAQQIALKEQLLTKVKIT